MPQVSYLGFAFPETIAQWTDMKQIFAEGLSEQIENLQCFDVE